METFKKKVLRRQVYALLGVGVAVLGIGFGYYYKTNDRVSSFIAGFQTGVSAALVVALLAIAIKSFLVSRNEEKLRDLYIHENDERRQSIKRESSSVSLDIIMYSLVLATAIAGNINSTVFFSLLGASAFAGFVRKSLKIYYNRVL
ncbi:MAG: hypothetical protein FWG10_05375 [Eubacteriaceae bacterium]|nr:hypothetical protein [Eubacteriaceae bacterium]